MLRLVERLASINSHSLNRPGLEKMLAELRCAFAPLDALEKLIDLAPYSCMELNGELQQYYLGRALHLTKRPEAPFRVLLGGHMDTVYPMTSPFQATRRLSKEILNGPGVADMKGGLVVMLKALETFETSSVASRLGWEVLVTADEELGSPSSRSLWEEAAKRCDIGLLFEPALPQGDLVSERAASANFTCLVRGRAAHAGRNPTQGRSAINALAELILELETLSKQRSDVNLNCGLISGGVASSQIAAQAACRVNIRAESDASMEAALSAAQEKGRHIGQTRDVRITWHPLSSRPHKPFDAAQKRLFEQLRACALELGISLAWEKSRGVCDGNFLGALGLPTVDTLGVVGSDLHSDQEALCISSLAERAALTARFLEHLSTLRRPL